MSKKKKIDWEKRQYEMASAIFFQDIRNYDIQAFHTTVSENGTGLLSAPPPMQYEQPKFS